MITRIDLIFGCDTLVATKSSTTTGTTILAKNSDRPVNECQPLVYNPRQEHGRDSTVRLEYLELPQPKITFATLGSSPYWCYGYESGVNEYGVAIGNEAIYTKTSKDAGNSFARGKYELGLLGMDLVRLGLERGTSAIQALEVMTDLLEKYGQFGSGLAQVSHSDGSYDNSYIIADGKEAYILETAGREWVAKKVSGVAAVSNEPTIRNEYDLSSRNLVEFAVQHGWWPKGRTKEEEFDFAESYIDLQKPLQFSHLRYRRSIQLLSEESKISPRYMARILRDHYEDSFIGEPYFNPALPDFLTLCMHSSPAEFTWGNTAASSIFILPDSEDRFPIMLWSPVTPCTGCYLPFYVHAGSLPDVVSMTGSAGKSVMAPTEAPMDTYSSDSYWWLFQELLDRVKLDKIGSAFRANQPKVRREFDPIENNALRKMYEVEERASYLARAGMKDKSVELLKDFEDRNVKEVVDTIYMLKQEIQ